MNFLCKAMYVFIVVGLSVTFSQAHASSRTPGKVIAGWVEKINLQSNDKTHALKAKLDTGAKTSSIHAKEIQRYKKDGDSRVRFAVLVRDKDGEYVDVPFDVPVKRKVNIKTHDGEPDRRWVVDLTICFDGRWHTTEFSLVDRSEYIYSVLLGRKFLSGVAVVDTEKTFLTLAQCQS